MDTFRRAAHQAGPPGPAAHFLWGHLREFREDVLALLVGASDRYGDIVRFRVGRWPIYLVNDPELARQILQERHRIYTKATRSTARIALACGESLLTANGSRWQRKRRRLQPVFQPPAVAPLEAIMIQAGAELAERWDRAAREDRPLDVASEMMRVTFTVAARSLFGAELGDVAARVERAMSVLLDHIYGGLRRLWEPPLFVPTPANRRFVRARRELDEIVYRVIGERRADPRERADLLTVLLSARDEETGERMTDRELRDEVITLLLAGHETTANALAWTWHLLSLHPKARRVVEAEVDEALTQWPPAAAAFARLPEVTRALLESLRLYPPIWIVERRAMEHDDLAGVRIPRGASVVVSPFLLHRSPKWWDDPAEFRPSRFEGGEPPVRSRPAYLPFGLGPRHCIGSHFALTEARILLAMLSRRFRLSTMEGPAVEPDPGITLRPRHGLRMRIQCRSETE